MNGTMTKSERTELLQLVRQRARVLKTDVEERGAKLLADFDQQLATIYHYDENEIWAKATAAIDKVVAQQQKLIAKECARLGIPREFAPKTDWSWYGRGENAVGQRRAELRRSALSRIEAMKKEARTKIERQSLEVQSEIVANGLQTQAARDFLQGMSRLDDMMPALDAEGIVKQITSR